MMYKIYQIHTLEGNKEVDLGEYRENAESKEQATRYAVAELMSEFILAGYYVEVMRKPEFTYIHIWEDIEDGEDRIFTVWASE